VVNTIINKLELKNTKAEQKHSNELKGKYDFVVSRAVTAFPKFVELMQNKIRHRSFNSMKNTA